MYPTNRSSEQVLGEVIDGLRHGTAWSAWYPLLGSGFGQLLPTCGGLYRIHWMGSYQLAYLGQTNNLRVRMRHLQGVGRDVMPYKDPHIAGPALYAYRHIFPHLPLEVSVAPLDGALSERERLGLECVAIAFHRQLYGSPLANFGRMPTNWKSSSGNTNKLIQAGKRFRGGPTKEEDESHKPGIAPVGSLECGEPVAQEWAGHIWTPWYPLTTVNRHSGEGLYRLRWPTSIDLFFLGQGQIGAQALAYSKKYPDLECSWVQGPWLPHQRLMLLTDLIASYVLRKKAVPTIQFLKAGEAQERQNGSVSLQQPSLLHTLLGRVLSAWQANWWGGLPAAS